MNDGALMSEIIFQVTEDEAAGFVARALGYAIVTQADTYEQLRVNVREAVICHFDQGKLPAIIRLHRVIDDLISVA
jgi:hypothetical protein